MNAARFWREEKTRYGLIGETCRACGEPIFPPRDICIKATHFPKKNDESSVESQGVGRLERK